MKLGEFYSGRRLRDLNPRATLPEKVGATIRSFLYNGSPAHLHHGGGPYITVAEFVLNSRKEKQRRRGRTP